MVRDWELHIHFKIHGQNTRFFGDGFAFWYTKERSEQGQFSIWKAFMMLDYALRGDSMYKLWLSFKIYFSNFLRRSCLIQCFNFFSFEGPVFGSKDFFHGLAIFFDTYANQNGEHAVSLFKHFSFFHEPFLQ